MWLQTFWSLFLCSRNNHYVTDPLVVDRDLDTDGDGLSNVDEIDKYGTNPIIVDTDEAGLSDRDEIQQGTDPLKSDQVGEFLTFNNVFIIMASLGLGVTLRIVIRTRNNRKFKQISRE